MRDASSEPQLTLNSRIANQLLMLGFGGKNKALLGIDISTTSIKLIELSQTAGAGSALFRVETFAKG